MSICAACQQPLVIEIVPEEEVEANTSRGKIFAIQAHTVPDDVELGCGCHFHWQCLLDAYQITDCPSCSQDIASVTTNGAEQQILCNLNNEGGLQEGLDILPLLVEDNYLRTYPEERKSRAFLEFCREGDVEAIVDLLDDENDEDDEQKDMLTREHDATEVLQYQDPLGSMYSGLHVAVIHGKLEVVWLLLFIASNLDIHHFPTNVLQAAQELGARRLLGNENGPIDIRTLRDADGMTAAEHAADTNVGKQIDLAYLSGTQ